MNLCLKKNLQKILERRELTKASKAIGVPVATLHGWLTGAVPSIKHLNSLIKLAKYLDMTLDELLIESNGTDAKETLMAFRFGDKDEFKLIVEKSLNCKEKGKK